MLEDAVQEETTSDLRLEPLPLFWQDSGFRFALHREQRS